MKKNENKNEVKISNDIEISKTLSWLLRHGAIRENLPITNDGYLEVDILLSHPSLVRLHCKHEDILRIVENDKKKRYTLAKCPTSDNKLRIKANQGHSIIEIDNLTLKRITNPSEISNVIHGTYYRYLDSIKKEGLKTMKRNFIHFTEKENFHENLSGFRRNCEILIYLDSAKAMKNGIEFYKSENNVILSSGINGCIKPEYFLKIIDRRMQ